jgi:hypothetical protein
MKLKLTKKITNTIILKKNKEKPGKPKNKIIV